MNYDVDYFIKKFGAIPKKYWCIYAFTFIDHFKPLYVKHCVLGHCGCNCDYDVCSLPESMALCLIFLGKGLVVVSVNDGEEDRFPQKHPKDRILAALRYIKEDAI